MKIINEKPPIIPNGYETVDPGNEKIGDLSYNVISCAWEEIPYFILCLSEYLPLRYPAIRKCTSGQ